MYPGPIAERSNSLDRGRGDPSKAYSFGNLALD